MRWLLLFALCACHSSRPTLPLISTGEASQVRQDRALRRGGSAVPRLRARLRGRARATRSARTLEDRPIVALRISRGPSSPTIFIQAGIHAGEIDGKDAGFWFLRDLLDGKVAPGALDRGRHRVRAVHQPRRSRALRAATTGRTSAAPRRWAFARMRARINLNRDFVKADSARDPGRARRVPQVRADRARRPAHHRRREVRARHRRPRRAGRAARRPARRDVAGAVAMRSQTRLTALGHLPLPFYPSFDDDDESGVGVLASARRRRGSRRSYAAARSRSASSSRRTAGDRTSSASQSTYHVLQALFEHATTRGRELARGRARGRRAPIVSCAAESPSVCDNGPHVTHDRFSRLRVRDSARRTSRAARGSSTTRRSRRSGTSRSTTRSSRRSPCACRAQGYIIDGGFAALLAPVLDASRHHVHADAAATLDGRGVSRDEGHVRAAVRGPHAGRARGRVGARDAYARSRRDLRAAASSRNVRLIVQLLDPAAPDSLAQWGFFNTAFERKEYMEPYVAEEARARAARDGPGAAREVRCRARRPGAREESREAARVVLQAASGVGRAHEPRPDLSSRLGITEEPRHRLPALLEVAHVGLVENGAEGRDARRVLHVTGAIGAIKVDELAFLLDVEQ